MKDVTLGAWRVVMSMGKEMLTDLEIEAEIFRDRQLNAIKEGVWMMRDGQEIKLTDMTNRHIENCIRMLEKKDGEIHELWADRFKKELEWRDYIKRIVSGELD